MLVHAQDEDFSELPNAKLFAYKVKGNTKILLALTDSFTHSLTYSLILFTHIFKLVDQSRTSSR